MEAGVAAAQYVSKAGSRSSLARLGYMLVCCFLAVEFVVMVITLDKQLSRTVACCRAAQLCNDGVVAAAVDCW